MMCRRKAAANPQQRQSDVYTTIDLNGNIIYITNANNGRGLQNGPTKSESSESSSSSSTDSGYDSSNESTDPIRSPKLRSAALLATCMAEHGGLELVVGHLRSPDPGV